MSLAGSPRDQAVKFLLESIPVMFGFFATFFAIFLYVSTPPLWLLGPSAVFGVVAAILAVLAHRCFNLWLSRFWLLPPMLPSLLLLNSVENGALSIASIFESIAFGCVVAFDVLWLLRTKLRVWLQ